MKNDTNPVGCGCGILLIAFNIFVGAWSVNYILLYFIKDTIPFIGAALIGLIAGEITVPVALVVAILKFFGVL